MINKNYSVLERIGLEIPVIGVKFAMTKPADLPKLKEKVALCGMLKYAQDNGGFYASAAEHECKLGPYLLNQTEGDPITESGQIGPHIGVYEDARANRQIYTHMLRPEAGTAPYTWFAKMNEVTFDPDLMIITAKPNQAEVIMRAHGYRNGAAWEAKGTTVCGCEYMYMYPYLTGKMNVLISGVHHGMKARQFFQEGLLFIVVPFQLIPTIIDNLETMEAKGILDLPQYHWGREAHADHMKNIHGEMMKEIEAATARE